MIPVIDLVNRLARISVDAAWAIAWQSALVAGIFALIALAMRRSPPGLRYWLWQIAAIKLLVLPLWSVSIAVPALPVRGTAAGTDRWPSARSNITSGLGPAPRLGALDQGMTPVQLQRGRAANNAWLSRIDWRAWLFLAWVFLVVGQIIAIARLRRALVRFLSRIERCDEPSLLALVAELSGQLGLRHPPEVVVPDGRGSPFVCGVRHPMLVLPRDLARVFEPRRMRSVLLHELASLKRRDLLWDWIPVGTRLLFFFNPAAHFIAYRTRLERELGCDQAAMILSGECASSYALTLVDVVSRKPASPTLTAALASARLDGGRPCPTPNENRGPRVFEGDIIRTAFRRRIWLLLCV